jgi:hypothetical protein
MKYYIQRGINEYGPYTLADLQRYVASGNILLTDLTRSEGMTDWVPVSQVIGNIPIPVPAAPAPEAQAYAGAPAAGTPYGAVPGYAGTASPAASAGPVPQDLHWALVLLIGAFCGIFTIVWILIEASFVRKLRPDNKGMFFIIAGWVVQILGLVALFATVGAAVAQGRQGFEPTAVVLFYLFLLGGWVLLLVGFFQLRAGLLEYYNTVEPINLHLSGVMTFFFAVFYFQHHFSRIAKWKKTGYLEPQQ